MRPVGITFGVIKEINSNLLASENSMDAKTINYPPEMFSKLVEVETSHWWFCARNKVLVWAMQKFVGDCRDFLEVGCGTGFVIEAFSRAFPTLKLSGTEYFSEGLSVARNRVPTAEFRQLDITKMDEIELHGCVGCFDVLEHIADDRAALGGIHQALLPGGYLMLTVPQHPGLWSVVDESAGHVRRYERADLTKKLKDANFEIIFCSSFVSLLSPLMWLNRRAKPKQDLLGELEVPRWLNRILEIIMGFELILLDLGIRFPFGGSLLLVARKKHT